MNPERRKLSGFIIIKKIISSILISNLNIYPILSDG